MLGYCAVTRAVAAPAGEVRSEDRSIARCRSRSGGDHRETAEEPDTTGACREADPGLATRIPGSKPRWRPPWQVETLPRSRTKAPLRVSGCTARTPHHTRQQPSAGADRVSSSRLLPRMADAGSGRPVSGARSRGGNYRPGASSGASTRLLSERQSRPPPSSPENQSTLRDGVFTDPCTLLEPFAHADSDAQQKELPTSSER